ncbi:5-methyltetrahydropteroyltriglutamate--homocysteine S-methyltransferase [Thermospira aquatica]|uniref:5-methyltetrahydropteroyltriglutamate--homocysteine S-methyltransferase n=1 Tax=Thermospira aquatica TaxID=2828656 RepID=A0AAX3BEB0_9SPIR|nr:5-methyltetrahydropteroyltriglutamate--homocysteine S-methyltransferase [Thermospira aquatica]URA10465.1 5-methyltetrahydropteroyltriglutamate--homocysteine S-methyltransferase [Thermospira aquatica]
MKTTVTGFPRIGKNREWKKALEIFWAGKISEEEILQEAQNIQQQHFGMMKDLDFVPIDFALYDHMLETSFLLGVLPDQVQKSSLSHLGKYFALARGFQEKSVDIKAWPMKKWFSTNYHCVRPKISPETTWEADLFFLEYKSTLVKQNPNRRWVIPGPYTFARLSIIEDVPEHEWQQKLLQAYHNLLKRIPGDVQLDEPALVFDMTNREKELFLAFYESLSSYGERLFLQTYFGDVRDIYEELVQLPVKGIGLDFVEGSENLSLIEKFGFPPEKMLLCGIVAGKNVWRTNYEKALSLLGRIASYLPRENIVLSSACSLLHVPYTIEGESFPEEIENGVCFALEKVEEIRQLALLGDILHYQDHPIFQKNREMISKLTARDRDSLCLQKLSALSEKDFQRALPVEQRLPLQKEVLNLAPLPTTTIGSFPQTPELRKLRKGFQENVLSEETYKQEIKKMIASCIKTQEELGIDVLVHGEYERNDMVEYFASFLKGMTTTKNGWVQSYGSRTTKPPLLYGDVTRVSSMTVEWITYAQSLTTKPVKAILTGPITIINWSFCREDISLKEVAYQIALALREEIEELQQKNIRIIQVDEAALRERLPLRKSEWQSYLDIATSAFRLATSTLLPEIQLHTHMCYSEFKDIPEAIEALDADVLTIEASRSELDVLESLRTYSQKRDIGPGVYDIHSPRVPSAEEIETFIQKLLSVIPVEHLWINPDCGLKTRKESEAYASLQHMVEATQKIRKNLFS